MATADDDMICMITIEHVEAVERIDEIMATPGIDLAVIGPGDLATSINKRGLPDDPEVLELMARALSNHEIAEALVISEHTARTHVGRVLAKLDLRDRVQAVVLAYEAGVVRPGET